MQHERPTRTRDIAELANNSKQPTSTRRCRSTSFEELTSVRLRRCRSCFSGSFQSSRRVVGLLVTRAIRSLSPNHRRGATRHNTIQTAPADSPIAPAFTDLSVPIPPFFFSKLKLERPRPNIYKIVAAGHELLISALHVSCRFEQPHLAVTPSYRPALRSPYAERRTRARR